MSTDSPASPKLYSSIILSFVENVLANRHFYHPSIQTDIIIAYCERVRSTYLGAGRWQVAGSGW